MDAISWKTLSRPLRVAVAAPWCAALLLAILAATPGTRSLLLGTDNQPTTDVSLSSTHWIGTLDAARLPASISLTGGSTLSGTGGSLSLGMASIDLSEGGYITLGLDGYIDTSNGGHVNLSDNGGSVQMSTDGGSLYTNNGGGSIITNGHGSPEGVLPLPVGSLYCNQDGAVGQVLYVKESGGSTNVGWLPRLRSVTTLAYAPTTTIDFAAASSYKVALTGNVTFVTSNLASGRSVRVRIDADSTARTLTFPADWVPVGAALSTTIPAGKRAILALDSDGTTDADVTAALAIQP